jgi:stage V sporulation protein B
LARNKNQSFLQGAAVLAASVAISKVLGAIFKISLGNILGDEGYGHFSVAYAIFNILLTVSTAGLPVALSRMIAASDAEGRTVQIKRNFTVARAAFFLLGFVMTAVMMLIPQQLAAAMDDPEAALCIQVLAPSILLVCLMSAYRGYTQGLSNMVPTSVSQVIEVLCKLVIGLFLAWWMVSAGLGLPTASAGAIAGVSAGSFFALVYMIVYKRKMDKEKRPIMATDVPLSRKTTLKKLAAIGIPIAIGSSILSILGLIDAKLILNRLQEAAGFSYTDAKVFWGVYSKAQTLFNLPSSFIVPVTISIIPAISALLAAKNIKGATRVTEASLKLTGLLALPAGVGLSVLSEPIFQVLYPNSNVEGPGILFVLGFASFFVCLTLITVAIQQAYGYERIPVYTMAFGGIMKIAVTWVLVSIPEVGVRGAAVGTLVCFIVISVSNILYIRAKVPERPALFKSLFKPVAATFVMGTAAYLSNQMLLRLLTSLGMQSDGRFVLFVSMSGSIIAAIIVYFFMIIILRAITKEDLAFVPKGDKIAKILRIKS